MSYVTQKCGLIIQTWALDAVAFIAFLLEPITAVKWAEAVGARVAETTSRVRYSCIDEQ